MSKRVFNIADVDLVAGVVRRYGLPILETLLKDRTTGKNIIWADHEYEQLGSGYEYYEEITPAKILDRRIIEPRVVKSIDQQAWRTKEKAEVFTPLWLCRQMVDCMDDAFFGEEPSGFEDGVATGLTEERLTLLGEGALWQKYVDNRLLEITCGEAPFICSPYDTTTGDFVPVRNRIGFLDRKLLVVRRCCHTYDEWLKWAVRAFESSYGYEYQGDNLLIARINLFNTFVDFMDDAWYKLPDATEAQSIAHVISWNIWQMDGLRGCVPSAWEVPEEEDPQMSFLDLDSFDGAGFEDAAGSEQLEQFAEMCMIYDWRAEAPQTYESLKG